MRSCGKAGVLAKFPKFGGISIAFDVEWLDWSSYYSSIPVQMTGITVNGMAMPDREFEMNTGWKDQWVFKLGIDLITPKNYK